MTMDRIEVITSVERRRRWSTAEKMRLVAAMDEPGAVVTEIARVADISASPLYRWRRKLKGACKSPAFVPVRVAPESSDASRGSAPVCALQSPSSPAPPPAQPSITIAFGEQVCMTIEGAPDAATLANVIGALRAPDRFR
jgi:transposase